MYWSNLRCHPLQKDLIKSYFTMRLTNLFSESAEPATGEAATSETKDASKKTEEPEKMEQ